ncbi:MAG: hypothetical protein CMJ47_01630 [Planctomyces sp.]|nr:hypothetical protein [Planctomyces sp.]
MIGLHHLESICCAMDEECSFWCDDYPISIVAKGEFDVEPIWNQAIFLAFHKTGVIDSENYHQFIANLLAMNYVTIVWQATTLVGAGKVANWDSKAWPLKQALFVAGQAKMPTQVHAQLLESFLKELRQSSCPVLLQSKIIQACLNALDSLIVVQQVRRNLPGVFRIDFGSENFVRRELDNWLRLRS